MQEDNSNRYKKIAEQYRSEVLSFLKENDEWWNNSAKKWTSGEYAAVISKSLDVAAEIVNFSAPSTNSKKLYDLASGFVTALLKVIEATEVAEKNSQMIRILDRASGRNESIRDMASKTYDAFDPLVEFDPAAKQDFIPNSDMDQDNENEKSQSATTESAGSSLNQKINQAGIELIKSFEGFQSTAYTDSSGYSTIGYGTREIDGKPIQPGMTITGQQAEEYLKKDLVKSEQCVSDAITVPLNSNQFSALVSFSYNVGCSGLKGSTLAKLLNERNYDVGAAFENWDKVAGRTHEGLKKRRRAERELFEKPEVISDTKNYWLLKLYNGWQDEHLKKDREVIFTSYHNGGGQREGYEEFQKVKTGDIVLGYGYGSINEVVCQFEITQPLNKENPSGEAINLKVTEVYGTGKKLAELNSQISFADELGEESGKKLFPLPADVYKEILNLKPPEDNETVTALNSDVPDPRPEDDSLDITPDVNALASVIAYKDLKTPLAIGLFGNWGSGKSFFMKKLQMRIDYLTKDKGDEYVKHVIPIEFNSWHYSDSNLWASFVTKIFEDLDAHGKEDPDSVKLLFQQLNENSEFLAEAKSNLKGIESTISKLEGELTTTKTEISEKAKELSKAKLFKIGVSVINNKHVKTKLDEAKKLLPQKELNNLEDISRSVKELSTFAGRFRETINLLFSFNSKQSLIALVLFIIICASPWWLQTFFAVDIQKFFAWFGKYSKLAATVFAGAASIATYATTFLTRVNEKLKSALATSKEIENEEIQKYQSEVDKIQSELDMQQQAHIQKEAEINKLKKDQAETQAAIDDIKSGKKLASFISSKVNDQRYTGSLGIISWIRKDFKKLDEILKEQRLLNIDKLKKLTEEERKKIFQVDRIVLYIDDLDRCKEEIVVRVLEAIHLLLAFELFVVVVGVDPRWMHNALNNNYKRQLKTFKGVKENGVIKDKNEEDDELVNAATSYDYLEKIFQVPFALNEIEPKGKMKLIDDLTKIREKEIQSDSTTPDSESTSNNNSPATTATVTSIEGTNIDEKDKSKENENSSDNDEQKKAEQEQIRKQEALKAEEERKQKELEEKKKQEQELKKAKEQLIISAEEIAFMKSISALIGNSPRTINRYINIYRIIRSHAKLREKDITIRDYCAVMVLLGIITGLPNESEEFFKSFAATNSGSFENLVSGTGDEFKSLKTATRVPFKISTNELVQRFSFRHYTEYEISAIVGEEASSAVATEPIKLYP